MVREAVILVAGLGSRLGSRTIERIIIDTGFQHEFY
jgi:choline kinase